MILLSKNSRRPGRRLDIKETRCENDGTRKMTSQGESSGVENHVGDDSPLGRD